MNGKFSKRILNFKRLLTFSSAMAMNTPRLVSATFFNRVPYSLQEKILLSTTSVNKCVLCARFASEMAFAEGVSREEVLSILNMDLDETRKCADDEMVAILYAQNYAETDRNPDPGLVKRLYDCYGKEKADNIAALTMKSHYYNLMGNTFSAFTSRLKGVRAPESSLLFELFFVLVTSPIVIPSWIYVFLKKNSFKFAK